MSERVIGGSTFTVTPLPAMRSFVLQPRLAPVLALVADATGKLGVDVDVMALAPVLERAALALPPAQLEQITRDLLATAQMDGRPLFTSDGNPFDVLMRGRTVDTWKLLWFALEVNYPDFFALLAVKRAAPATADPSAASSTSPTSGPAIAS